jgi:transcription initiation factor TFIIA large subunit
MDVAAVYLQVIRNVVDGVRADFSTEQLDEASLRTLATLWEHKLLESGALANSSQQDRKTEEAEAPSTELNGAAVLRGGLKRKAESLYDNSVAEIKTVGDDTRDELPAPEPVQRIDKPSHDTEEFEDAICAASAATDIVTNSNEAAEAKIVPADRGETLSSDSEDDSHGAQGVDIESANLVLAQFDKVARAKNKWKCSLKGGVMTLNGKDALFGKANGEFFWN